MQRFIDNQDGTVTDSTTGLTWSKDTLAKDVTHEQALEKLSEGWRLPTVQELFSLTDHSREDPAIDTDVFPGTESDWYWTSTPCAWNDTAVWVVDFDYGYVYDFPCYSLGCVRACRG